MICDQQRGFDVRVACHSENEGGDLNISESRILVHEGKRDRRNTYDVSEQRIRDTLSDFRSGPRFEIEQFRDQPLGAIVGHQNLPSTGKGFGLLRHANF
jgi:hypothetical protein